MPVSELTPMQRLDSMPEIIDLTQAKTITNKELDRMVSEIEYIQLDSREPIGTIDKMAVTGDKIFILDASKAQQLFVFDKKGKLLFRIKQQGSGPEEYISLWDMQIDTIKNEILIDDALGLSYIYYSAVDGSFIRKEKAIQNCGVIRSGDKYLNILTNGQSFSDEDWQIIVSDRDSAIYKGFHMQPLQKNDVLNNTLQYDNRKNILFVPSYSDTVYRITPDFQYHPLYVIKQEKSIWKKNNEFLSLPDRNRLIRENGYTEFKGNFLSTDPYVSFSTLVAYQNSNLNLPYFWNKKTRELYKWDVLHNDWNVSYILVPPVYSDGTYFYGTFHTYGQKSPLKNLNADLASLLDRQTEDSNPILIKFALK